MLSLGIQLCDHVACIHVSIWASRRGPVACEATKASPASLALIFLHNLPNLNHQHALGLHLLRQAVSPAKGQRRTCCHNRSARSNSRKSSLIHLEFRITYHPVSVYQSQGVKLAVNGLCLLFQFLDHSKLRARVYLRDMPERSPSMGEHQQVACNSQFALPGSSRK